MSVVTSIILKTLEKLSFNQRNLHYIKSCLVHNISYFDAIILTNYESERESTPLEASAIRFPHPRQSFVQPRNLDKDDITGHTRELPPMNYAKESGTPPLFPCLVKFLLEESVHSTKKFSNAAVKNTAVEKGAPLRVTPTTEG